MLHHLHMRMLSFIDSDKSLFNDFHNLLLPFVCLLSLRRFSIFAALFFNLGWRNLLPWSYSSPVFSIWIARGGQSVKSVTEGNARDDGKAENKWDRPGLEEMSSPLSFPSHAPLRSPWLRFSRFNIFIGDWETTGNETGFAAVAWRPQWLTTTKLFPFSGNWSLFTCNFCE